MAVLEKLNLGIVGACRRGGSFARAIEHMGTARIHAVCDVDTVHLPEAAERMGADEAYTDYYEMLERSSVDAVIIGTPIDLKRLIKFDVPTTRVLYELQEIGHPTLEEVLEPLLD